MSISQAVGFGKQSIMEGATTLYQTSQKALA